MNFKSILISFGVFIVCLIGSLVALDAYTLRSINIDSSVVPTEIKQSRINSGEIKPSDTSMVSPVDDHSNTSLAGINPGHEDNSHSEGVELVKQNGLPESETSTPSIVSDDAFVDRQAVSNRLNDASITQDKQNVDRVINKNSKKSPDQAPTTNEDSFPVLTAGDISGRIFSNGGVIIPNIVVTASPYDINAGQNKKSVKPLITKTNELGQYAFNDVPKASYRICTPKSEKYTRSCTNIFPPQKTVDLKIFSLSKSIKVTGIVSNEEGKPLQNVNVRVNVVGTSTVVTQADGSYQLVFKTQSNNNNPNIQFTLKDHIKLSRQTNDFKEEDLDNLVINASLIAKNKGFSIKGRLLDRQGDAAPNQRIRFSSASDRSKSTPFAVSNIQGEFVIKGVEPASDYFPKIITNSDYRYKTPDDQQAINVIDDVTELSFELEKLNLDYQPMTLFMATNSQQPIAGLTLNLKYQGKYIDRAVTDETGSATFKKVPIGNLSMSVASLNLRVTGLSREKNNGATIIADKGDNEARISVLGNGAQSVVCKHAVISSLQVQNNLTVRASRTVQSDETGVIYATDFGSGEHTLRLSGCEGHKNYSGKIDIGSQSNFSITLNPS